MNTLNEKTKKRNVPEKYKVEFRPNLNGTYTINFDEAGENAGFTVLLQGGLFHTFPDGYVVTKRHLELLKDAKIPYKIVEK